MYNTTHYLQGMYIYIIITGMSEKLIFFSGMPNFMTFITSHSHNKLKYIE